MLMQAKLRGRVQRVGFRATAQDMARSLNLIGFVRNCDDGSVDLLASGEKEALEKLVSQLKEQFSITTCDLQYTTTFEIIE